MSYHVYIYDKSAKEDPNFTQENPPKITNEWLEQFKQRLILYNYILVSENDTSSHFKHPNEEWGISVSVHTTEIAFNSPFNNEAIFEMLMTATELCDHGNLVVFDPQDSGWIALED